MTNEELIETAKEAMKDLWEINHGRLLEHEQTAYNCLRLFCEKSTKSREDFCLWYYAQPQPLDAHKIFDWFNYDSA